MNIEIIKNTENSIGLDSQLDSTREFGILLNKITLSIKMMHWYVLDYNAHKILGNLYDDISDLFDTLQEEIIGTSKSHGVLFPKFNLIINSEDFQIYKNNEIILENFYKVSGDLKNLLNSSDFTVYVSSVTSGINNTKEEIVSLLNKTEYLIGLLKF